MGTMTLALSHESYLVRGVGSTELSLAAGPVCTHLKTKISNVKHTMRVRNAVTSMPVMFAKVRARNDSQSTY